MRAISGVWRWALAAACVAMAAAAVPVWAEDIPAFDYAYGQPAVWGVPTQGGSSYVPPPLAVDASHIYVGGPQVNVFSRDGDWQAFWPFSSPTRGIGVIFPDYGPTDPVSQVMDMALGPGGVMYLLDPDYAVVQRYTSQGEFLDGLTLRTEARPTFTPTSLALSPDTSLYALSLSPGWPAAIGRFASDGTLLGEWTVSDDASCIGIAPAAPVGVWALLQGWDPSSPSQIVSDVVYYSPDGVEGISWRVPDAVALKTDIAGNVYVLLYGGGVTCFDAQGAIQKRVSLQYGAWDFAVTPEGTLLIVVISSLDQGPPIYSIEEVGWDGAVLRQFGDYQDLQQRGALLSPRTTAFTPDGQAYVRAGCGNGSGSASSTCDRGPVYVAHFDPAGQLVDVTDTPDYPFYNRVTGTVEISPGSYNAVAADGTTRSWICTHNGEAIWTPIPGTDVVQCMITINVCDLLLGNVDTHVISGPAVAAGSTYCPCTAVSQQADGSFLVGIQAYSQPGMNIVWGGIFDADWKLLESWQVPAPFSGAYVASVARDPGGNFYFARDDSVSKFSASGAYLGEIGRWSGAAGKTGSLMQRVSSVNVDDTGHVRVLDQWAGRMLVFTYRPGPFSDVPWYYWAKDQVQAAVDAKIVNGYPDGTYRPDVTVTRDQMAVYIARALAGGDAAVPPGPRAPIPPTFDDVMRDSWEYDYVEYCAAAGIVLGYDDGKYHPELPVDRGQMAVFIARSIADPTGDGGLAGYTPPAIPSFPDVTADHWAFEYVEYVKEQGVVTGYPDGTYRPEIVVTRDQMAVYVARAFKLPL